MAQFSESFLADLRERIDLVELVSRHVVLKRTGLNWQGLCPFHQEKTPSFNLRPDRGHYKCFGCGAGGDAIDFIRNLRGSGFTEAVTELATLAGIPLPEDAEETPAHKREREERQQLVAILESAKNFYRESLHGPLGGIARDYLLEKRGLRPETMERFQLGFAPAGWRNLLGRFGSGEAATLLLEKAGLILQSRQNGEWYDRFRHRIIFPIHGGNSRCIGFGGRVLTGEDQPKYLNSPETSLYQKGKTLYGLDLAREAIRREDTVLVVEGYLDLIALADHGIQSVVATLGTALTIQQLKLLHPVCRRVIFCFDGDRAGRAAAWRALEMVLDGLESDRFVSFLLLPDGEDPDNTVRREGADGWRRRMDQAMPLLDFILAHLGDSLDATTPEGRAALFHRARASIRKVPDPLLRELYMEALQEKLHLPRRPSPGQAPPSPERWDPPEAEPQRRYGGQIPFRHLAGSSAPSPWLGRDHERQLLAILLRFPQLILEQEEALGILTLADQGRGDLLTGLIRIRHLAPTVDGTTLIKMLSNNEMVALCQRILNQEEVLRTGASLAEARSELAGCLAICRQQENNKELAQVVLRVKRVPGEPGGPGGPGVHTEAVSDQDLHLLTALRRQRDRHRQERSAPQNQ